MDKKPESAKRMKITVTENRIACNAEPDETRRTDSLLLANENYPLNADYEPYPMYNTCGKYSQFLSYNSQDMPLQAQAYNAFLEMMEKLNAQGYDNLLIISTYRDYNKQSELYNSDRRTVIVTDEGREITDIARPGCSDHQLGLAVDMQTSVGSKENFDTTSPGQWISQYGHDYGFILRYPEKDVNTTGVVYEPWHFRFVGIPHAAVMRNKELCLEDYLDFLRESRTVDVQMADKKHTCFQIIYYQPNERVLVPREYSYTISGDNRNGTIVTIKYN